jgi:YidC/Oxa1 family membrane protein insertase
MSQAPRKGSFLQTMLLVTTIFLAFQLFFGNRPQEEKRTPAQILTAMREMGAKVDAAGKDEQHRLASNIQQELGKLRAKANEEAKANKIDQAAAKDLALEGLLVATHLQMKVGVLANDMGPLTQAYLPLHDEHRARAKDPSWVQKRVEVTPTEKFPETSWTGDELHSRIVLELGGQAKAHRITGVIPGYDVIDGLVALTGRTPAFSYAFAALLLALLVRAVVWPLAQKQYMWGRQMAQLQPLVKELKERYTDKKTGQVKDMAELQQKTMGLYREYGINPMSGCLPMFVQLPFFLIIYQCMLQYRFEFQKGHFLWISPGLGEATNGFIAPNLGERDYILVGIYAVSMVVTTLLTPVSDPSNAKQQRIMGVSMALIFSVVMFFYPLPSAFVLYWVFLNVFATLQMVRAYKMTMPPLVKVNAPTGGVYPVTGPAGEMRGYGQTQGKGVPVKHKPKKNK